MKVKIVNRVSLAVLLSTACLASVASADESDKSGFYFESGLMYSKYEEPAGWFTNVPLVIRIGTSFSENLSVEGTFGTSIADTDFYAGSTLVSARVNSLYSLGMKYELSPKEETTVFGKLGVGSGTLSASTSYGSAWSSGTDIQYGVGIRTNSGAKNYWSLDYTSYYNKSSVTLTGLSLTYGTRF